MTTEEEKTEFLSVTDDAAETAEKTEQAEQPREIPDELVETKAIADEFRVDFSRFMDNTDTDSADEAPKTDGEKKQLDFSFHTVELSHQSASSLARLEKLFGKK